jgi:GNAT superfamily N-acetyltransferase
VSNQINQIAVRKATRADPAFVASDGQLPDEAFAESIDRGRAYVAEIAGGERVGFARLEYLWSKVPYLALIRVAEQHRRHGVGRALLQAIGHDLRATGHDALYSSSQVDEPEPQAWHRHVGSSSPASSPASTATAWAKCSSESR